MDTPMSFWDHLDVLRATLLRILAATVAAGIAAFCMKDALFTLVLWPCHADFPTWQLLGTEPAAVHLVNTELTEQLMLHLKVSLVAGVTAASPYIVCALLAFVAPALYAHERRTAYSLVAAAYAMFALGAAVSYLLLFPLTLRFLASYSVSDAIEPLLSVSSYVDTLAVLTLLLGTMFELPVAAVLLARAGLLRAPWMSHYRRHAIVAILIVAAVVTPTADAMTLAIVALPVWLLYEASILLVHLTTHDTDNTHTPS